MERLSPRQREVLTLACDGLSRDGIAERLGISPRTVKNHLTAVYDRLDLHHGCTARTEACVRLFRHEHGDGGRARIDLARLERFPCRTARAWLIYQPRPAGSERAA